MQKRDQSISSSVSHVDIPPTTASPLASSTQGQGLTPMLNIEMRDSSSKSRDLATQICIQTLPCVCIYNKIRQTVLIQYRYHRQMARAHACKQTRERFTRAKVSVTKLPSRAPVLDRRLSQVEISSGGCWLGVAGCPGEGRSLRARVDANRDCKRSLPGSAFDWTHASRPLALQQRAMRGSVWHGGLDLSFFC